MSFCEKCGAKVNDNNDFCEKCGTRISKSLVLNTISTNSIQDTKSLSRRINELADDIDSLESIIAQTEALKSQLNIPEPQKPTPITRWGAMKGNVILGIVAIALALPFVSGLFSSEMFLVSIFVVIIGGCLGTFLIFNGYKNSTYRMERHNNDELNKYNSEVQSRNEKLKNLQQQYDELETSKEVVASRIRNCLTNNENGILIPENYFYSDAIRFFADRIATGRSNSLAEAMDAYDEHLHRLKLEQAAFEAAEYQRQSADNLAAIQREQAAIRRQETVNTALHVANTIRHW